MTAADPTAVTGRRVAAFVLDGVVVVALAFVVYLVYLLMGVYEPVAGDATCDQLEELVEDCQVVGGTTYVTDEVWPMVVAWAAPIVLVHVVAQGLVGFTPGKGALRIRAVSEDGEPAGPGRALVRTALLVVDSAPWVVPAVGLATALGQPGHRRVGDMAARTFVVGTAYVGRPIAVPGLVTVPYADRHRGR